MAERDDQTIFQKIGDKVHHLFEKKQDEPEEKKSDSEFLAEKADEMKNFGKKKAEDVKEATKEKAEDAKEYSEDIGKIIADDLSEAYDATKEFISHIPGDIKHAAENIEEMFASKEEDPEKKPKEGSDKKPEDGPDK